MLVQLNGGRGPDLLGVCEVENEVVVNAVAAALNGVLPGRDYRVAHADTSDDRGIFVAFIHEGTLLDAPLAERFQHVVMIVLEVVEAD